MGANNNENDIREEVIQRLIASYKTKYEGSGAFFIHPTIEYYSSPEAGVGVRATEVIPKGTFILTVPNAEQVSLANIKDKELKKIIGNVEAKYEAVQRKFVSGLGCLGDIYTRGDIALAVLVMYEVAQSDNDESKEFTKAWPSLRDFQTFCYPIWFEEYQSEKFRQLLQGTSTLELLGRYEKALRYAFVEVVQPVLTKIDKFDKFLPSSPPVTNDDKMENLWESFRYASSLVRSRSHASNLPGECKIIPIVDLTNGAPAYCSEKINVQISNASGTSASKKTQQLETTSLVTTKDIAKGQELILSYGDVHGSHFAVRYGCFPSEIVHCVLGSVDQVTWHIPASMAPLDQTRADACRKAGLPSTVAQLKKWFVGLHYDVLQSFRNQQFTESISDASPQLQMLKMFLVISHLLDDDGVLQASLVPRMLEGSWNKLQEAQLLLLVVDYNLRTATTLDTSTNQKDLDQAALATQSNDLVAAYRARVCQRDTLAQWRHAICQKYQYESEHVVDPKRYSVFLKITQLKGGKCAHQPFPKAPQCLMDNDSNIGSCPCCGRMLDLKACGRCKQVQYCCQDHQRRHWKLEHKKVCDPSLAAVMVTGK